MFPHITNHRLNSTQYFYELTIIIVFCGLSFILCIIININANGDVLIADCECYQADRAISTGQLNILLCLHLLPINAVVYCDPNWEVLF